MAQGIEFIPTYEDRKLAESMSGFGVPQDQIACLIGGGIDLKTLYKYFTKELAEGKAKANSKVGQTLFQKVMDGDTTAAIWWSKTQMGWKETKVTENTIDGEININQNLLVSLVTTLNDVKRLTDDELFMQAKDVTDSIVKLTKT